MRLSTILRSVQSAQGAGRLLVLAALLAGCATQNPLTRAVEAEQKGDPYRAAQAYAEVLRSNPHADEARADFERTSRDAARFLYAQAQTEEQAGRYAEAVARLDELAVLSDLADELDVSLDLPDGYDEFYSAMNEEAVSALVAEARSALNRGQLKAARRYIDRTRDYTLSSPDHYLFYAIRHVHGSILHEEREAKINPNYRREIETRMTEM